jgi:hypothetical protein
MYIDIDISWCMDTVHTRLCMFTTTLHFPSFPISLATPASLCSAQEPLLLSYRLLGTSLFNWQTTRARLATPKLPQEKKISIFWTGTACIHNSDSISSREAGGRGMSRCPASASLCRSRKLVETTVYTMYIHCTYMVHIWFIHWPTMYMWTDYSMLVPLRQFPLRTRL